MLLIDLKNLYVQPCSQVSQVTLTTAVPLKLEKLMEQQTTLDMHTHELKSKQYGLEFGYSFPDHKRLHHMNQTYTSYSFVQIT